MSLSSSSSPFFLVSSSKLLLSMSISLSLFGTVIDEAVGWVTLLRFGIYQCTSILREEEREDTLRADGDIVCEMLRDLEERDLDLALLIEVPIDSWNSFDFWSLMDISCTFLAMSMLRCIALSKFTAVAASCSFNILICYLFCFMTQAYFWDSS